MSIVFSYIDGSLQKESNIKGFTIKTAIYGIIIILTTIFFTACSSSDGSSDTNPPPTQVTGQFIDDNIQGLTYTCSSGSTGITNANGDYTCNAGDNVTFKVGDMTIGTLAAQSQFFTPYSFHPTSLDGSLNLASLLQSLDSDGDSTNGSIVIDNTLASKLSPTADVTSPTFRTDTENDLSITLVSQSDAQQNLNKNIEDNGGTVPDGAHTPIANAGTDQNVHTTDTVVLNGSVSSDVDQRTLEYTWSFMSKPAGSNANLSDSTLVTPSFVADLDGEYILSLVVNTGTVFSVADTIKVTATTANSAPVADADVDSPNVNTTSTVTLDGSGSSDADLDSLTYSWTLTSRPDGSSATLTNPTAVNPAFLADVDGSYVAQLIVNDGTVNSAPSTIIITATTANSAPVADADVDSPNVNIGSLVTLDGSSSSDADADSLTYSWLFVSKPTDSTAIFDNVTIANPTFTADKSGSYVVQLIVNDGTVDSLPDTVTITADTLVTYVSTTAEFRLALTNAAQNGVDDKIILADGIYRTTDDGRGTFNYLDNEPYNLTLTGSNKNNVILSGNNQNQIFNHESTIDQGILILEKISFIEGFTSIKDGAGIYSDTEVKVLNCMFKDNNSSQSGGGIYTLSQLIINNSNFENNLAKYSGGGAFSNTTAINNSIFIMNSAELYGGAIHSNKSIDINNSNFVTNSAKNGGAFSSKSSILENIYITINNSFFTSNYASNAGAGFYYSATSKSVFIQINDSTFDKNNALYRAGGFYFYSSDYGNGYFAASVKINNTNFISNIGGGFYAYSDNPYTKVVNSKFINNSSNFEGAAFSSNSAVILNSIFDANTDGVYLATGQDNIILNSIFDNNGSDINGSSSSIVTLENSYIDKNKVNITSLDSNNIFTNITLGFINREMLNYHLTIISDLIDAGTNDYTGVIIPSKDLDGYPRPTGASTDIGPYEYQP